MKTFIPPGPGLMTALPPQKLRIRKDNLINGVYLEQSNMMRCLISRLENWLKLTRSVFELAPPFQ